MVKYYSYEAEGFVEHQKWDPRYWINVSDPSDDDYALLARLGVPDSFTENLMDMDERPRFEREDGWLLTIVRVPYKNNHDTAECYTTVPMGIMTKDDIIITLCATDTGLISDFIEHCNRRHIAVDNQPDFVLRIIFSSTYWFLTDLKEINKTIQRHTDSLSKGVSNDTLFELMNLQKSLVYFNTSLQGNSMLIQRLDKVFEKDCDPELVEDVEIELSQAENTVNVYIEILSNSMDTFASVISNNVNGVMKTMTSISLILMIPTLIASFYGMNVDVWFGTAPQAFLFIILFAFAVSGIAWWWLRRRHWL